MRLFRALLQVTICNTASRVRHARRHLSWRRSPTRLVASLGNNNRALKMSQGVRDTIISKATADTTTGAAIPVRVNVSLVSNRVLPVVSAFASCECVCSRPAPLRSNAT